MTTANTSLVATTVSASAVAAAAAAAVASLAFLISVIMVASAVTATVTPPTRSTAIAVVRGTARSHGVEMEMGWETAGWVGSKVSKYPPKREKKLWFSFLGHCWVREGKMLTFLFAIWQMEDCPV